MATRATRAAPAALLSLATLALAALLMLFAAGAAHARPGATGSGAASAQRQAPVALRAERGGLHVVEQLALFEDTTRALGIDQVRAPSRQARFEWPDHPLVGPESDRVLWFRLRLTLADPADAPRDWLMLVPTVSTHELRFYGPFDEAGHALAEPVVTGMRHPWSTRPADSEQMAWRFRLPEPGQVYTVYFRVESTFARVYDVTLWDTADYLQSTQDKRMFDGVSYGVLLGLVVYGLVLMLVFNEAIYVYYLLSCFAALLAIAGFNGHTLRYPFADWPAAAGLAYTVAPALWAMCKLQFGRQLLRTRHFAPRLDWLVRAILAALGVAVLYALWGAHPLWMFRMVQASVVVSTVLLVAGGLVAVRRRYWPAVLYCVGVAALLAGICAIIVASWGLLAWTPGQMNITQAALVAELVVFAIAMASRLRLMRRSEQALSERTQQLVEALGTDALTGAASRSGFEARGGEWLAEGAPFALMLLDLDGFKGVNDQHGHAAGDAVLMAIAQRLRQRLGPDDLVARLGGDEFALLVRGAHSEARLAALAAQLLEAGSDPVEFDGLRLRVGMSLGIARHPGDGLALAELLRAADRAMYAAKQSAEGPAFTFAPAT